MAFPSTYRIGIIADTHDRWHARVAPLFAQVDEIWHLGDVCHPSIIDELRALNSNFHAVLGNNDYDLDLPEALNLERGGERFHLVHILPRRMPAETDWLLYGHTHRPTDEMHQGIHLFNPGSAGRANKGAPLSIGFLIREKGKKFRAEVALI